MKIENRRKYQDKEMAYALARVMMGVNLFLHGLVRVPKLSAFKAWMIDTFDNTILNETLVGTWATLLPFLELAIGALLLLGLFTRKALLAGAAVLIVLLVGSCLKENWEWVGFQMIYALYLFLLMIYVDYNRFSLDSKRLKK